MIKNREIAERIIDVHDIAVKTVKTQRNMPPIHVYEFKTVKINQTNYWSFFRKRSEENW